MTKPRKKKTVKSSIGFSRDEVFRARHTPRRFDASYAVLSAFRGGHGKEGRDGVSKGSGSIGGHEFM